MSDNYLPASTDHIWTSTEPVLAESTSAALRRVTAERDELQAAIRKTLDEKYAALGRAVRAETELASARQELERLRGQS